MSFVEDNSSISLAELYRLNDLLTRFIYYGTPERLLFFFSFIHKKRNYKR